MSTTDTLRRLEERLRHRSSILDWIGHDVLHAPVQSLLHTEAYECRRDAETAAYALRQGEQTPIPDRRQRRFGVVIGGGR